MAGGLFKPIIFYGSCGDSGDEEDCTRSGSHVSMDSAYSSDAVAKNSPTDATQGQVEDGAQKKPKEGSGHEEAENESKDAEEAGPSKPKEEAGSSKAPKKMPMKIEAKLHSETLWRRFLYIGNEMIVTKPGR